MRWWAREERAGVCKSSASENKLSPTASRCLRKSSVSAAAARTENFNLLIRLSSSVTPSGYAMEREASITIWHRKLVSSSYRLTNILSVRA